MSDTDHIRDEIAATTQALETKVHALEERATNKVSFFAVGLSFGVGLFVGRQWALSTPKGSIEASPRTRRSLVSDDLKRSVALGALVAVATEVGKRRFPDAKDELSNIQSAALSKIADNLGAAFIKDI